MRFFLYSLLVFTTSIAYADNKITATYDAKCDEKNELFFKRNNLLISNRYKVVSTVQLDKSRYAYILDRNFSQRKSKECQYSDPTIHNYIFVITDNKMQPIVNRKLLSNLDYLSDISMKKDVKGFSISLIYGQTLSTEAIMKFDSFTNNEIFLREIISQKVVPDGVNSKKTSQKLPFEKQYELSNVELSNFL